MTRFQFANRDEARLVSLRQFDVYYDLLEGFPTTESNAGTISYVRKEAETMLTGAPITLIEPREEAIPFDGSYPFGTPSRIPRIASIGHLEAPSTDPIHRTRAIIVWFQERFGVPIDSETAALFRSLSWQQVSETYEL